MHFSCIYTADCIDGQVRLAEGQTELEGRLDVCFKGRWGSVGSEGWSPMNTQVVRNYLYCDPYTGLCIQNTNTNISFPHSSNYSTHAYTYMAVYINTDKESDGNGNYNGESAAEYNSMHI